MVQQVAPPDRDQLLHGDALDLADRVFCSSAPCARRASARELFATFMAKPMEDEPGTAMHIHQSIVDGKPANIFTSQYAASHRPSVSTSFIAGQQTYLPVVMRFRALCQFLSALEPGHFDRSTWNGERTIARPASASRPTRSARRVENRVSAWTQPLSGDGPNLACGYLGMKNKMQPRAAVTGEAYDLLRAPFAARPDGGAATCSPTFSIR